MRLILAEVRKLLTTKTWIFLLLGSVAFTALIASLTLGFAGVEGSPITSVTAPEAQQTALSAPASANIFVIVLGIIGMTQEYRHRTATPTFLTTPKRGHVVAAKLVTYLVVGLVFAVVAGAVAVAITTIWVSSAGGSVSLSGDNLEVLLGSVVACGIYGAVGVGIGALVRNQVGAVVGALAYLFVLEPILRGIPATRDVYVWLPGGAQEALTGTTADVSLLEPWQGGLLLLAYGVVTAVLAMRLTVRRDIA